MNETKSFADFGVDEAIVAALSEAAITTPFPIQELTLPLALSGADLIGQARTGTGKTLAFGIPLLQRIDPQSRRVQALVVVPTRELCVQVRDDLQATGQRKGAEVVAVYGGKAIDAQSRAIQSGAPIVVGTPGRLLDLMRRGILDLSSVTALVLDEADEMLDLGFLPDVQQLIEACAADRQTMLFSATMPAPVVALARRYMTHPTFLRAEVEEVHVAPETEQHFFSCHRMDKAAVLARILQTPGRGLCVVFTSTKRMADVLAEELRERGIDASPIHSDLRQEARERTLQRFRSGKIDVLVATEVAARGLDIDYVTHVVNYDCPDDEKMYLHRIGRTGRAGAAGVAITLAMWNELARVEMIKRALDINVETLEVFSTSPILDELFDLPERAPRPAAQQAPARASRRAQQASQPKPRRKRDAEAAPRAAQHPAQDAQAAPRAAQHPAQDAQAIPPAAEVAAPAPVESQDPAGGREDASGGRRRQGRGRRRWRSGEPSDTPAGRTPPEFAASASPEPAAPSPAADEPATAQPAPRSSPAAEAADDSDPGAAPTRRVRTRTRSSERGAKAGSAREPGRRAAGDRKPGRGPRDAQPREQAAGARGRSGDQPAQRRDGGRTPGRRSEADRPAERRSGARSSGSRSGGRRSGGDRSADRRPASRAASDGAPIDVDEARGRGKPALRRPLVVQNLP